ncbi:MAG: DedA family protein [Dehalococcoidia bacterium]|nr:DedA family protein [Dehalococcoidia bacterium]
MSKEPLPRSPLLTKRRRDTILSIGLVALALGVILASWLLRDVLPALQDLGYVGIFLIGVIGAASVVALPSSTLAIVCVGATLLDLHPVAVGLAAGAGESLGELVGYLVGLGSQTFLAKGKIYTKVHGWVEHRGGLAIFVLALVPNPLFDLVGLAAGSLRFPVYRFFLWVLAGKSLRDVAVATICSLGLTKIPGLF